MISRQQWDQLSNDQKFEHLFRQSQWAEQAIHNLSNVVDGIRERLPKQDGKVPPTRPSGAL
jgi:hypothetical protein